MEANMQSKPTDSKGRVCEYMRAEGQSQRLEPGSAPMAVHSSGVMLLISSTASSLSKTNTDCKPTSDRSQTSRKTSSWNLDFLPVPAQKAHILEHVPHHQGSAM
jgi:hypothetical protein